MLARLTLILALLTGTAHANGYAVGDTFEDPMQIAQEAVAFFPMDEEGRPRIEVDVSLDFFGKLTILVANSGLPDDSVAGERNQYVLEQQDGVWVLIYQRTDYRCRRGNNTVTWQTNLCP
ncbi:hypothetical protein A8B78_18175 [Jannaschia sp. EhC01]|uniref:Uncharacterized protein n=1 Tax=Gymnodinialimonas phycosphaerae TaxID=2841589 RepID=A0A975TU27_9RHOB|nr:hypothetical protein [Gymnodinialimonas phycosphaerae]MBY4894202.1 hypothetical protein [Gymnodinialimonas phycosphaerae]OAN73700.1 hypothetical protein A8B78_18175 [Jannaschia sp. EhC01]